MRSNGEPFLQLLRQISEGHHTTLKLLQQIRKQNMALEIVAKLNAPRHILHIMRHGFVWKEQSKPLRYSLSRSLELPGIQHLLQVRRALE